ncbi:DUF7573 domain-containing protein [Halomontanus rarus]|uniref:DUF7573 domain-containing protein n=1 Tax=Halomontanus rarus TaxID=3034020 RepID=UPI0023E75A17|nr:hypothetical protein [Halovivax sp. TS33]
MTEDPTLTDFLEERGGDDSAESSSTESDASSGETSSDERGALEVESVSEDESDELETGNEDGSVVASAEPATTTYAWGSYVCDACGSSVERVWKRGTEEKGDAEDDDEANGTATDLVCKSCKIW